MTVAVNVTVSPRLGLELLKDTETDSGRGVPIVKVLLTETVPDVAVAVYVPEALGPILNVIPDRPWSLVTVVGSRVPNVPNNTFPSSGDILNVTV